MRQGGLGMRQGAAYASGFGRVRRALSLQWPTRKASWSEPLIFLMK